MWVWLGVVLAAVVIIYVVVKEQQKMGTVTPPEPREEVKSEKSYQTKGGMGIDVFRTGSGPAAKYGDHVTVHYRAFLTNGVEVDSSYSRGQAFTFKLGVGAVIIGWDECIRGMKAGEMRKVTLPPKFAYGAKGSGKVPPNATIAFEIDLLSIQPK